MHLAGASVSYGHISSYLSFCVYPVLRLKPSPRTSMVQLKQTPQMSMLTPSKAIIFQVFSSPEHEVLSELL